MGYSNLAEAAVGVATNNFVINGYTALWNHGLFFSKCKNLSGWKRRPPLFAPNADALVANKGNQYYTQSQLKGLQYLAGLTVGGKVERSHFDKLKKAYGKWEADFGVVDYGANAKESNACNIFVSESIYWLYNNSQKCLNGLQKYYSAKEYWNNNPGFNRIKPSDVRVGDIAAMSNGNHVEIVTNVMRDRSLIDDGFCSRGAGRNSLSDNGKEKCDGFWNIGYTPRELEDDSNRFYRIK